MRQGILPNDNLADRLPVLHLPVVRVVRLAPDQAEMALDAAVLGGRLALSSVPVGPRHLGTLRRVVGRLEIPYSRWAVPFELELAAWSSTKAELVLRPLVDVGGSRRRRHWFRAGHALMDLLVAEMEAPVVTREGRLAA
jgi:hypothetical protein